MGYCTYELILLDVYHSLDPSSQKVYRVSKELEVGTTLEEFSSNPKQNIKQFHEASKTLDELLTNSNYLQGDNPGFFDYRIFGVLQCVRSIKKEYYNALVNENPYVKVAEWTEKMDNLFDGYLKNRKTL
jgi:glutathione S-transferase